MSDLWNLRLVQVDVGTDAVAVIAVGCTAAVARWLPLGAAVRRSWAAEEGRVKPIERMTRGDLGACRFPYDSVLRHEAHIRRLNWSKSDTLQQNVRKWRQRDSLLLQRKKIVKGQIRPLSRTLCRIYQ